MKAIRVHEYGGAEKLIYEDAPLPEPRAGEVRVKVSSIGLNFIEIYQRKGLYSMQLPFIPGNEATGVVDALGEGVSDFKPGDRVATAAAAGSYAEYALVRASQLVGLPQGISLEEAAAVLLQGITAHYLVYSTFPLKPEDTALVHAAASGVGLLLVQLAKKHGARVISTVSTEEKAQLARKAGADEVILYTQVDFEEETRRLTGGKGVDVVFDSVGQTTFLKGLNVIRPRGMMVLYGQSSGPVDPINPQILNQKGSLFLTRPTIGAYMQTREELLGRCNDLFSWMTAGELDVRIDRTFRLHEAAAAHLYMEGRGAKGKILLQP
jgi:NADPH2:quinone reductase